MEGRLTLNFSGDPETMKHLVSRLKEIAINKMKAAETLEESKKIWDQWQPFQNDPEFFQVKELTKKRLR